MLFEWWYLSCGIRCCPLRPQIVSQVSSLATPFQVTFGLAMFLMITFSLHHAFLKLQLFFLTLSPQFFLKHQPCIPTPISVPTSSANQSYTRVSDGFCQANFAMGFVQTVSHSGGCAASGHDWQCSVTYKVKVVCDVVGMFKSMQAWLVFCFVRCHVVGRISGMEPLWGCALVRVCDYFVGGGGQKGTLSGPGFQLPFLGRQSILHRPLLARRLFCMTSRAVYHCSTFHGALGLSRT